MASRCEVARPHRPAIQATPSPVLHPPDRLQAGDLPTMRRCAIYAHDCARGMAYLHNKHPLSIIHRDLKPANRECSP